VHSHFERVQHINGEEARNDDKLNIMPHQMKNYCKLFILLFFCPTAIGDGRNQNEISSLTTLSSASSRAEATAFSRTKELELK
jgi:hypothetical protein